MKKKLSYLLIGVVLFTSMNLTSHQILANSTTDKLGLSANQITAQVGDKGVLETSLVQDENVYISDDPTIITIDNEGNWEAKQDGETEIRVTGKLSSEDLSVNPFTQLITVSVEDPNTGIQPEKQTESIKKSESQITPAAGTLVPDPVLSDSINTTLNRPLDTEITEADLASLTTLSVDNPYEANSPLPRLNSLEGLQYATNLTELYVYSGDLSAVDSLESIRGLSNLINLSLGSCKITTEGLSPIVDLINLEFLDLGNNNIKATAPLEPLFQAKLEQYRQDPAGFNFYMYHSKNPIIDHSGSKLLFELEKEISMDMGSNEADATMQAANSTIRSINPMFYELSYQFYPDYEPQWGMPTEPNKTADIWAFRPNDSSSPEKNRIVVKDSIIDFNGNKALMAVTYDWREDIDAPTASLPAYTRISQLFNFTDFRTNGADNSSGWVDDPDTYFALESRESFDHPGETEYYYNGREFNIVPYNPNATGAADRQDSVLSMDGMPQTVYYLEFKDFKDPVLLPNSTEYYYPTIFENVGNTTTITFGATPYITGINTLLMNSASDIAFEKVVHWIEPETPFFEGLTNETITAGTIFDPLKDVYAFDPTKDQDNPDGSTPKDITDSIVLISGQREMSTPGTYTFNYTVISPYGVEASGERTITVVAGEDKKEEGNGNTQNNTPATKNPSVKTGDPAQVLAMILLGLAGISGLVFSRKRGRLY